ncbi:helix-turn-helix transcriptional regulator [Vibrio methylphosphonaticus]|uniref:helix-turn-helix transcriptional regulator n=1 Tax=Vibrio methylphosphonaticus TaxID=2946866 RepID=UPI0029E7EFCE|nr:AlpA family phage regulatory protein [Vibrio methylphosphonaticus]
MLIKKATVAQKLSVSSNSLDNWDDLPNPIQSAALGKCRYYNAEQINGWLLSKIDRRPNKGAYLGDIQSEQCIRMDGVQAITGLSRSKIYALISENAFPRQVSIGQRTSVWLQSEVEGWLIKQSIRF